MKVYFYIVSAIAALFLTSCGSNIESENSTNNNNFSNNNRESSIIDDLPPIEDDKPKVKQNQTYKQFPFGCPTLVNFSFSDDWNIIDKSGSVNFGFSPYQRALLEINECLQQINNQLPIEKPTIKKANYLKYFENDNLTCDNIASYDTINTELPNIGKYKTYYAFGNAVHDLDEGDSLIAPESCVEYGNLVLVDSITKEAKVLNLYLMKVIDTDIYLRMFYIDKEATIKIMEVTCGTKICKVLNRYTTTIDDSGRIYSEKVKNFR